LEKKKIAGDIDFVFERNVIGRGFSGEKGNAGFSLMLQLLTFQSLAFQSLMLQSLAFQSLTFQRKNPAEFSRVFLGNRKCRGRGFRL
jgi:hypothetical protein